MNFIKILVKITLHSNETSEKTFSSPSDMKFSNNKRKTLTHTNIVHTQVNDRKQRERNFLILNFITKCLSFATQDLYMMC